MESLRDGMIGGKISGETGGTELEEKEKKEIKCEDKWKRVVECVIGGKRR